MADAVRAAVLVAPGRYEVQEFPRPALPDGALLMQVEMSGICGTDKHTFLGETKQYAGTPAEAIQVLSQSTIARLARRKASRGTTPSTAPSLRSRPIPMGSSVS